MASGENVLYLVEGITPRGYVHTYVFRTRKAARAFMIKKNNSRGTTKYYRPKRAVWGPDN